MDLDPTSLIQWICRECVRKLGYNECDNSYDGFKRQLNRSSLDLSK